MSKGGNPMKANAITKNELKKAMLERIRREENKGYWKHPQVNKEFKKIYLSSYRTGLRDVWWDLFNEVLE